MRIPLGEYPIIEIIVLKEQLGKLQLMQIGG